MKPPIEEILGLDLMAPERQGEVIFALKKLALPVVELRALYARWARVVGVPVTTEDLAKIGPHADDAPVRV